MQGRIRRDAATSQCVNGVQTASPAHCHHISWMMCCHTRQQIATSTGGAHHLPPLPLDKPMHNREVCSLGFPGSRCTQSHLAPCAVPSRSSRRKAQAQLFPIRQESARHALNWASMYKNSSKRPAFKHTMRQTTNRKQSGVQESRLFIHCEKKILHHAEVEADSP